MNKSQRVLKLYILFQRQFVLIIKPMKPKVTFGASGNTYSINPTAANVAGDSYSRTNSISYGGPTIAYGDPRTVTNVRTSGAGSYGASNGQARYTLPQGSINTGNYVEGAFRTPSYIQTQGQEFRTSSQYVNVAQPQFAQQQQFAQQVRVAAPTYVNQSVPVAQVYQNQVAANPVYTQDYGRTTYTNNRVASNAQVAVNEEKKAGFDCSPICWGLLGLLGLLGLILGLLFGLGVIGGGSGNQTATTGITTNGTATTGTTTTNGGVSGTTTTGFTTNGGTSGTTSSSSTSTSTSTSTNTGTTSGTVGGQTGSTTTVNTSTASVAPTVVAPLTVQTTQWNSGTTSGTTSGTFGTSGSRTSGTTTVNGSGLQTNTQTFSSQQFGPLPFPVTHLTNLHEY